MELYKSTRTAKATNIRDMTMIRKSLTAVCAACLLFLAVSAHAASTAQVDACFSPDGKCGQRIVNRINTAKERVYVAAFSFTSKHIAKALLRARQKGLDVRILLDAGQWKENNSRGHFLREQGLQVRYDAGHKLMHSKYMVIDDDIVITGSYNFTNSAEYNNAENVLVLRDEKIADRYLEDWKTHWDHGTSSPDR